MSCDSTERKTYSNIKRLAEMAHRLTGRLQTVYQVAGKAYYGFCESEAFSPQRGRKVSDV